MYLLNYNNDEFVLCTSYEKEYPSESNSNYLYRDAQIFKLKPTRHQAEEFYAYYVPAMGLLTGTLLTSKLEEIAFKGEIRIVT